MVEIDSTTACINDYYYRPNTFSFPHNPWKDKSTILFIQNILLFLIGSMTQLINNYSSTLNGLWVNSPWQPHGLLTQSCFSKIQLVGQKYWDKTTWASKMRFSRHYFAFQSWLFPQLLVNYNIYVVVNFLSQVILFFFCFWVW